MTEKRNLGMDSVKFLEGRIEYAKRVMLYLNWSLFDGDDKNAPN